MKVRIAVWNGDTETVVYKDKVNWGIDTLRFRTTVLSIVTDALKNYQNQDSSIDGIAIDITDERLLNGTSD